MSPWEKLHESNKYIHIYAVSVEKDWINLNVHLRDSKFN